MTKLDNTDGQIPKDGTALVEDLLAKCQKLLAELETFGNVVATRKLERGPVIETRKFQNSVITEHKSLQKIASADLTAEKTIHTLRSSNVPFYTAIWEAAKTTNGLIAFNKRFYWEHPPTRDSKRTRKRKCAPVDIVAKDGEEWIKVSTITESRLAFEFAKAQWEAADSSSEDELGDETHGNGFGDGQLSAEGDILDRLELVKAAHDLLRASKAHRVHYHHPRIRLILPKISSEPPAEIMPILDRIRSSGAVIELGEQMMLSHSIEHLETKVFPKLLPSPHPPLTDTLNIDCTILLALVSDLSHSANHPIEPGYNAAIRGQIELETKEHLLPTSLWPAMAGRDLVCTNEAAKRMREIVDTIGMPKEKSRTELILADGKVDSVEMTAEARREAFDVLSDYTVPPIWQLPIRIVPTTCSNSDIDAAIQAGRLPRAAGQVAEQLTDINRSVFIYGWMHGVTTVSSNRTVAKQIETIVEKEGSGSMGPEIWLREPARSLLGKEKERRK